MTVIIQADQVLRTLVGDPILLGESLYKALSVQSRVVLCTTQDVQMMEHYLKSRGIKGYGALMGKESALPGVDLFDRQIEIVRSQTGITLIVESDPESAVRHLDDGLSVLLFLDSVLTRPEFLPDFTRSTVPWDDLKKRVEDRNIYRTTQVEQSDYPNHF